MAITKFYYPGMAYRVHVDTDIESTAVSVREEPVTVYSMKLDNTANAAASFYKFWNTTAAVTVGTTAPTEEYLVPASTSLTIVFPGGKLFTNGLVMACLTTAGTAGVTSPASSAIIKLVHN